MYSLCLVAFHLCETRAHCESVCLSERFTLFEEGDPMDEWYANAQDEESDDGWEESIALDT